MTIELTIWTGIALIFGAGTIFIFGVYVGLWIALKGVNKALAESSMKNVLQYKDITFVPVVRGDKK